MKPIVKVEGVSKQYQLGVRAESFPTLRDTLAAAARAPFGFLRGKRGGADSTFWALRGVGFEVMPGEVVGIIGRNGAGKSTLLKILSRITEPTSGRIELYGRVASLLEVGTGFHPELTGRENIFLNGAILGMARTEIARKFDEIVAFAEVDRFIDTPVKRYSSGMYVRLAFAVAAHLEPEVLIIDEVLAVGDGRFQRKCLDKMQEVGKQGRTVLFVSHNMPAVTRLCPRTILLDGGLIVGDGPSSQIVGAYLSSGLGTTAAREWPDAGDAPGNDVVRLCAVRARNENGEVSGALDIRRPVEVEIEYEVLKPGYAFAPNLHFNNEEGVSAFISTDLDPAWRGRPRPAGRYVSAARVPGNMLSEGTLFVGAAVSSANPPAVHFFERDAIAFQVIDSMAGDSARGDYTGPMPGVMRPLLQWSTRVLSENGLPAAAREGAR